MLKKIKKFYKKEQFFPSIIGLLINPFYFARKGLHENISDLINTMNGKLLDIGCGTKPYAYLCPHVTEYIGLEIDNERNRKYKNADFFYDGVTMPFTDKSFDSILCNQVLEHVFNPDIFLKEINRVSRIGGKLLLSVPFVWDEHEQPYDYARYSSFGLKHILHENGFEVIGHRKSNNGIEVIFQLVNSYIYKITLSKNRYINLVSMLFLMAPVNILGVVFALVLPRNDDLYLDNIVLAKKVKDV